MSPLQGYSVSMSSCPKAHALGCAYIAPTGLFSSPAYRILHPVSFNLALNIQHSTLNTLLSILHLIYVFLLFIIFDFLKIYNLKFPSDFEIRISDFTTGILHFFRFRISSFFPSSMPVSAHPTSRPRDCRRTEIRCLSCTRRRQGTSPSRRV